MTPTQTELISIRKAVRHDISSLWNIIALMKGAKEEDYFARNFNEQDAGNREIFIASFGPADAGYCILNWQPKYGYFKVHSIPETQDLNVVPEFRRKGIAKALIGHCEQLARRRGHDIMGISVGLDAGYGPAQRLYVTLGYIPDGFGITYDRKTVMFGDFRPVDDNLCLMMVKTLQPYETK